MSNVSIFEIALLALGVGPFVLYAIFKIIRSLVVGHDWYGGATAEEVASYSREAPWRHIGSSSMRARTKQSTHNVYPQTDSPIFQTVRTNVGYVQVGTARWRLCVRFLLLNPFARILVIDDMHTRVFERTAPWPPYGAISYYGEAWLSQDNTLWKDARPYSLKACNGLDKEGFEIDLFLEATRIEGAPAYRMPPTETAGKIRVIFGLLVDYYLVGTSPMNKKVVPSDAIYFFECDETGQTSLRVVDRETIDSIKRGTSHWQPTVSIETMERYLNDHLAFSKTPKIERT